jgi:hypothetical protein
MVGSILRKKIARAFAIHQSTVVLCILFELPYSFSHPYLIGFVISGAAFRASRPSGAHSARCLIRVSHAEVSRCL